MAAKKAQKKAAPKRDASTTAATTSAKEAETNRAPKKKASSNANFPEGTTERKFLDQYEPQIMELMAGRNAKKEVLACIIPKFEAAFNVKELTIESGVGQVSCPFTQFS